MSITIVQNILKEVSSGCHALILPHLLCRTLVPYDILKVGNPLSTQSCRRSHHPISPLPPISANLRPWRFIVCTADNELSKMNRETLPGNETAVCADLS